MTERSNAKGGLTAAFDRVVGDRIKHGIDWRVRQQVAAALPELAAALRTEDAAAVITELAGAETARRLAPLADAQFSLRVMLGSGTRVLNQALYTRLLRQISELTGVAKPEAELAQSYRSLLDAESRGLGRIAGTTYNILGKLTVPRLLELPDGPVLEIGTLYGLFSPTLLRQFRRGGQFRTLTAIDPFAGLQLQGGAALKPDPSGTPVTEDVARANYGELSAAGESVRVITGYSSDETVRKEAGDRAYALVVIDGDHFEAGVRSDLEWVETILAPGGVAVIDDFGDRNWPDVEKATRAYLASDGAKMRMLGQVSTSAYLQLPA